MMSLSVYAYCIYQLDTTIVLQASVRWYVITLVGMVWQYSRWRDSRQGFLG